MKAYRSEECVLVLTREDCVALQLAIASALAMNEDAIMKCGNEGQNDAVLQLIENRHALLELERATTLKGRRPRW